MSIPSLITRSFFGGIGGLVLHGLKSGIAVVDTHDGADPFYHKRRRLAKLAEEAAQAKYPKPRKILTLANPLKIEEIKAIPKQREITVAPFIYEMGRMPLANPMQWLLDDDEEAIEWLIT